jgi:rod shape-determining protein MreC
VAAPRHPRSRFLLLVLLLLGVTFVTLSDRSGSQGIFNKARSYARDVANPVQSAVHSALQPVGNFLHGATNYGKLEKENQYLRQELAQAQTATVGAESLLEQSEQVLAQEHLDYLGNIPSVAAQVIDVGSANFEQTMEINRGASSGVVVGQPVVSGGGLIGKVSSLSAHLATVTLLDDPSSVVGVRVLSTGVVGAAAGEGEGNLLQVENVEVGAQVKRGDPLVTSGLQGEDFPAGIPVGTVASVSAPAGGLQLAMAAKPYANLVDLQFVRVLLWSPQTH